MSSTTASYTPEERQNKLNRFRASKSKMVSAKEYESPAGKVLTFNSTKSNLDFPGKFGTVCQYTVYDSDYGMERSVNTSALSYVNAVEEILGQKPSGTNVNIRIRKTGTGSDTRYTAELVS